MICIRVTIGRARLENAIQATLKKTLKHLSINPVQECRPSTLRDSTMLRHHKQQINPAFAAVVNWNAHG
jgi:hypothetical protein